MADRTDCLLRVIDWYDPMDSLALDSPGRWALVEESTRSSERFVTVHETEEAARDYQETQEYAEDWELVALIDLDQPVEL